MKSQPRSLIVLRTADIAQLVFSTLLEPFDANSVEVRDHREHSNMRVFQTKSRSGVCLIVRAKANPCSCRTKWGLDKRFQMLRMGLISFLCRSASMDVPRFWRDAMGWTMSGASIAMKSSKATILSLSLSLFPSTTRAINPPPEVSGSLLLTFSRNKLEARAGAEAH